MHDARRFPPARALACVCRRRALPACGDGRCGPSISSTDAGRRDRAPVIRVVGRRGAGWEMARSKPVRAREGTPGRGHVEATHDLRRCMAMPLARTDPHPGRVSMIVGRCDCSSDESSGCRLSPAVERIEKKQRSQHRRDGGPARFHVRQGTPVGPADPFMTGVRDELTREIDTERDCCHGRRPTGGGAGVPSSSHEPYPRSCPEQYVPPGPLGRVFFARTICPEDAPARGMRSPRRSALSMRRVRRCRHDGPSWCRAPLSICDCVRSSARRACLV